MLSIALVIAAMYLSGCLTRVDTEGSQEQRNDVIATLGAAPTGGENQGFELRQTFVSRRARLNRVEVWLRPVGDENQSQGYVSLELRHDPDDPQPLAQAVFTSAQLKASDAVALNFAPQPNSGNMRYELRLRSLGGETQVLGRFEDIYGEGTANLDGAYLLADSAFRLAYDYNLYAFGEDALQILRNAWLIFPLFATLLLPGWLLLEYSQSSASFDKGEKIALSLGLSLASVPLLMTWTSWLGLGWSRAGALAGAGFLTAIGIYRLCQNWRRSERRLGINPRGAISNWLKSGPTINLGLLAVFGATLIVRVAMVRDLSAPPWVDSVHHALITRLIMENGAFPESYAPYIDIQASSYHPGYHAVQGLYLWLSGQDLGTGMLFFGQVLNALNIFAVYLFTTTLTRNRLAGLLAALASGMFTPMPAYYTSWGRYTQLAALSILPVALALFLRSVRAGKERFSPKVFIQNRWRVWLLAGISLAGLALTHYRVAAFFACLVLALALVEALRLLLRRGATRSEIGRRVGYALAAGLGVGLAGLLLSAPWSLESLKTLLLPRFSAWRPTTPQAFEGATWAYLYAAWGNYVMALAGLGWVWGVIRRRLFPLILTLWVAFLFFIANLGMYRLPGSGFVNAISVTISLYLPLAALAGYLLSEVFIFIQKIVLQGWQGLYRWTLAGLGLVACVLAARPLIPLLNPVTFLSRPADRLGIAWVAQNVPPEETVLVNPFAWGYGQYAGNDGGYWISASARRVTFPPPVLYGLSNSPEYIQEVNAVSQKVIDLADDPAALHALLQEQGIRYVYIGGRGGVLSAQALRDSPLFAPRYAREGVFVFEVLP